MTKQELIDYFNWLAKKYDDEIFSSDVNTAMKAFGKREAYEYAAHIIEREMEDLR